MEKYLVITMPDGSKWEVPAKIVAHDRADYYANKDFKRDGTPYQQTYDEEFAYTLSDEDELTDWAANNINWSEVQDKAVKVGEPSPVDYADGWSNGDKELVVH